MSVNQATVDAGLAAVIGRGIGYRLGRRDGYMFAARNCTGKTDRAVLVRLARGWHRMAMENTAELRDLMARGLVRK